MSYRCGAAGEKHRAQIGAAAIAIIAMRLALFAALFWSKSRHSKLIACVALCAAAMPASALVPTETRLEWISGHYASHQGAWFPSLQAACEHRAADRKLQLERDPIVRGPISVTINSCAVEPQNPNYWPMLLLHESFYMAHFNEWRYVDMDTRDGAVISRQIQACPANSTPVTGGCRCNPGSQEDGFQRSCLLAPAEPLFASSSKSSMCQRGAPAGYGAGQPILPAAGEKYRDELDYADSGPDALSFARTYRSTWASDSLHTSTGMCLAVPVLDGGITLGDIGIGAAIGGAMLGLDRMFNDAAPPRGLPPEGVQPPIPEADQCKPGPASRPSERDKGGQSLWDPNGGEWRWFPGDKWHNPHWDHNAHDGKSSPWVNVPHGGLPPVKK